MVETANLSLPLLAAGQAQKHVTVNEALTRLDSLFMLAVESRAVMSPPAGAAEGDRYIVPAGASGDWAGRDGDIAVFVNGGWDFVTPRTGWRAFVADEGLDAVFAWGVWSVPAAAAGGAQMSVLQFDHAIAPGGAQDTAGLIPAGAIVMGVTARVIGAIGGVTGWSLGVAGAPTRYGAGLPTALNAAAAAGCGGPLAYPQATPLRLTPEGGDFAGGQLRIAIHHLTLTVPDAV
ncbi:DUF2793 domain-containing protein [Oceanicella actignis]|uniref:Uncharacterized protein n=1 Tax=Oceanicella actignis TaxID=1189325 RepID=A0A1M7TZW4_9RHOB|nr:DUF2793 domain-containing protein [Oceanicella actignis]TYO85039.1 uncharacterized protein DUF2793 [Oceanicella actignis]SET83724.1 Protein of unknown function [Oceanicella actignis]SHN76269.1 Protein of unknown function [Oceanicella actignis]